MKWKGEGGTARALIRVALAIALWMVGSTRADAGLVFTLTQSNTMAIGPDGGNYGKVTVDTHATDNSLATDQVRFVLAINPLRPNDLFMSFGFNSDVKIKAANVLVAPTGWKFGTNDKQGGFGKFDYVFAGKDDPVRVSTATFVLKNLSKATISDFTSKLSSGAARQGPMIFAARLDPGGSSRDGVVGSNHVVSAPEPSTMVTALFGLIPASYVLHRRGRRRVASRD